jgi:hypothetical protein
MTIVRAIALLAALFFLLPTQQAEAQASAVVHADVSRTWPAPVQQVLLGGRCPRLCVEWFDGCNNCTCGKGRIDVCTQQLCVWRRRPRCLRYGF